MLFWFGLLFRYLVVIWFSVVSLRYLLCVGSVDLWCGELIGELMALGLLFVMVLHGVLDAVQFDVGCGCLA